MGNILVEIARKAIEKWVREKSLFKPESWPKEFNSRSGVFVSLYKKSGELRGCIGYPESNKPLIDTLIDAAIGATKDPRFEPLSTDELSDIVVEVSVLSRPRVIKVASPEEYLAKITPGKDGLIIEREWNRGLFLPQVWNEIKDKKQFLEHLCQKAGLEPDEWKSEGTKLYRFRVQIFKELR